MVLQVNYFQITTMMDDQLKTPQWFTKDKTENVNINCFRLSKLN